MNSSIRKRLIYGGISAIFAGGAVAGSMAALATGETSQNVQDLVTNGLVPLGQRLAGIGTLDSLAKQVPLSNLGIEGADGLNLSNALTSALEANDGSHDLSSDGSINDVASHLDARSITVGGVSVALGCASGAPASCTHVTGTSTTTGGTLTIPVHIARTVNGPLLSSILQTGNTDGHVAATLTFDSTLQLSFDYAKLHTADPTGLALASPTTGTLAVTLDTTPQTFSTSLGFTDVSGTLNVTHGVLSLAFTLTDPDNAGGTDLGELATNDIRDLVTVSPSGTLDANVQLDSSLVPGSPDLTLTWSNASLTTASFPTPTASGPGLSMFTNASPDGVFGGIAQLGNALQAFQANGDLKIPFLSNGLATLANFTQPIYDFIAENGVVCASGQTNTPDGTPFTAGMLIYCQATAAGGVRPGSIEWDTTNSTGVVPADSSHGNFTGNNNITAPASDGTVAPVVAGQTDTGPTSRAVFFVTDPSNINVKVNYEQCSLLDCSNPSSADTARSAQQPPRTAQQLAQRLADAGLGSDAASIMSYDQNTQAITFHIQKTLSSDVTGNVGFDVGDKLKSVTHIGDVGKLTSGTSSAQLNYDISGVTLDITFGVLLTSDVSRINPTATYPSTLPRGDVDRFFIQVPDSGNVLSLANATADGQVSVDGRIGFLGVHVGTPSGTTSFITKPDAGSPLLAIGVSLPGFDVEPDATPSTSVNIPHAIQLRNLGDLNLIPGASNSALTPTVNAGFHLPLTISADFGSSNSFHAEGDTSLASVGVTADIPDASQLFSHPDTAVHVSIDNTTDFTKLFGGLFDVGNIGSTDDPLRMFSVLSGMLNQLLQTLEGTGITALNQQIPVIDKSPKDLLAGASCLSALLQELSDNTSTPDLSSCPASLSSTGEPATLQAFLHDVEDVFHLPTDSLTAQIKTVTVGGNDKKSLVLGLDLDGTSTTSAPLAISLGSNGSLAAVSGSAPLDITANYQLDIHPGITLDTDATPFLLGDSHIHLDASAETTTAHFDASIGPLSVHFGNNIATGDNNHPALGEIKAGVGLDLNFTGGDATHAVSDLTTLSSTAAGTAHCTDGTSHGTTLQGLACLNVSAAFGDPTNSSNYLGDLGVAFPDLTSAPTVDMPDDLLTKIQSELLDPTVLLQAFSQLVDQLGTALAGAGNNFKVPVLGDALDAGANIAHTLHDQVLDPINQALAPLKGSANAQALHDGLQSAIYTPLHNADLLRTDNTSDDAGAQSDITVTVMCGSTDCSADNTKTLSDVTDVRVQALLGQGIVSGSGDCSTKTDGASDAHCSSPDAVPFDIGLDGLPLHLQGAIVPHVGWRFKLDVGISRTDGPYVGSTDLSHPLLQVGAGVGFGESACAGGDPNNIPGTHPAALDGFSERRCLQGQLAFLTINARDGNDTGGPPGSDKEPSHVSVSSSFAIHSSGDTINAGNIGSIVPAVQVSGDAAVNLRVRTLINGDNGLPSILGAFHASVSDLGYSTDSPTHMPNFNVSFDGLTLDAGAFFSQTLGPIVNDVKKITSPLKPIIDTLQAPLPVLTQLAALVGQPPVTLLSIIEATTGQNLDLVNSLLSLIQFANNLPTDPGELLIPLDGSNDGASFSINSDKARASTNTPNAADSIINQSSLSSFTNAASGVLGSIPGANPGGNQLVDTGEDGSDGRPTTFGVKGLDFPFLTHPSTLAGLLLGKDIDLVTYDAGTMQASASTEVDFGPFFIGPVPVTVFIGGGVTVKGRFAMGYDSSGFREFAQTGQGSALLDGLFLSDWDSQGTDVPEISLIGDVHAGAEVDIVIAAAGVQGGITLTVDLNLHDPNNDGKLHFDEIKNLLANPICLFDVDGSLDAYLEFFLKINLFFYSDEFDFPILNVHLLDFHTGCSGDQPPELAHLAADGTLRLNMGPNAADRHIDTDSVDENFTVTQLKSDGGNEVEIKAFGITQQYGSGVKDADGNPEPSITLITANGANGNPNPGDDGNDVVKLLPGGTTGEQSTNDNNRSQEIPFSIPAQITMGAGNDQVVTGDAADTISLGGGNDKADAGDGADTVNGGDGNDTIDGGGGSDHLFGDDLASLHPGADVIHGGPGADLIDGRAGADNLDGGPAPAGQDGPNVLIGGGGGDNVTGGAGDEAIILVAAATVSGLDEDGSVSDAHDAITGEANPTCPASGSPTDETGSAFGGAGDDTIIGDNGADNLVGNGGKDRICGLAGNDTILGDDQPGATPATGPNSAPDSDYIDAGDGNDQANGGPVGDDILGGAGSDVLTGEGGDDHIVGGTGLDIVDAGSGNDVILGDGGTIATNGDVTLDNSTDTNDGSVPTCQKDDHGFATDDPSAGNGDCISGGDGADNIYGQGGEDKVSGDAGNDTVSGGHGPDTIRGGADNDTIHGDGETDTVYGDSGNDTIYGDDGNDQLFGLAGDDNVFGNEGDDTITGDGGQDDLVGGSDTAGAADGSDNIHGGEDVDFIAGDNATIARQLDGLGAPVPDPNDGSNERTITLLANNSGDSNDGDHLYGDAANDRIWGEQGDDTISGGTEKDVIFGNEGVDTITGDTGSDLIVGGSADVHAPDAGDHIHGNVGDDVIIGDNGTIDWNGTVHLGPTGNASESGNDVINGDAGDDIIHGQDGNDELHGDADNDRMYGELGDDTMTGDTGFDYMLGDQGTITPTSPPTSDVDGSPIYNVQLIDANAGGVDTMDGGLQDDHMYGGWQGDTMSGGPGDDYMEGNGGNDSIYGVSATFETAPTATEIAAVPLGDDDDIIGGSSNVNPDPIKSDTGETLIQGNAGQDVILGDNGSITRVYNAAHTAWVIDPIMGGPQRTWTLFDTEKDDSALTAVSGGDTIQGNDGNDRVFGEGGNDTINGNNGNDILVGNQDSDTIHGDNDQDDLVGGSLVAGQIDGNDFLYGDAGQDVATGDNATIDRPTTGDGLSWALDPTPGFGNKRVVTLLDTEKTGSALAQVSGNDLVHGNSENDKLYGEAGDDSVKGGTEDDYIEGNQGSDLLEGNDNADDIIGGSTSSLGDGDDVIHGGGGDDVSIGDNGRIVRIPPASASDPSYYYVTYQLGETSKRAITLNDIDSTDPTVAGSDQISGGTGVDVLFGQGKRDYVMGGGDDDYMEGNGGSDFAFGDKIRTEVQNNPTDEMVQQGATLPPLASDLPEGESPEPALSGGTQTPGQDDMIGGSSKAGLGDVGDYMYGNGAADYMLGDNGTIQRVIQTVNGVTSYVVYTKRYAPNPTPAQLAQEALIRVPVGSNPSTRFCSVVGSRPTCEASTAFGDDVMYGDAGDDTMYGQDGNDTMHGGGDNDDMYGELGNDRMFGDGGQDAMVGDRGGIVDTYIKGTPNGNSTDPAFPSFTTTLTQPPAITYHGFVAGTVDRRVDLTHDVVGDHFVGTGGSTSGFMKFDGMRSGGDDVMRGGNGRDSMHGAIGDDQMNGDSGGDTLFGDDGADVMWGGRGCDPAAAPEDQPPTGQTCAYPNDATQEGTAGSFLNTRDSVETIPGTDQTFTLTDGNVDYLFAGHGGTSTASQKGTLGADILDWRPRGSATTPGVVDTSGNVTPANATCVANSAWPVTPGTGPTLDPCAWLSDTNTDNDPASSPTPSTDPLIQDNQHHQGIDWMYGGWDRDILQADVADNGPNGGDRLLDWDGAYNLYTHCNAAYGGFNDVRQLSPQEQSFMQQWAYSLGAGQLGTTDVTTAGTSGYDELALVYQQDIKNNTGKAYPTTPGHFDSPNSCGL